MLILHLLSITFYKYLLQLIDLGYNLVLNSLPSFTMQDVPKDYGEISKSHTSVAVPGSWFMHFSVSFMKLRAQNIELK